MLKPRGMLTPSLVCSALGLASRLAEDVTLITWSRRELQRAYDWAMREHLSAAEEPGDYPGRIKRVPEPDRVQRLHVIEGIDFDGKGRSVMRLWDRATGARIAVTKRIPKS